MQSCSCYKLITDFNMFFFFFAVQYLVIIYRFLKGWRENPQWSLKCCLAMLLPLNELQGELRGLVGTNVLNKQLQTGKINMPSISSTLKDTGVMEFSLEETDEANLGETQTSDKDASTSRKQRSKLKAESVYPESDVSMAEIIIHEPPKETYETSL